MPRVWPINEIVCLSIFIVACLKKIQKEIFQNANSNHFLMKCLWVIFFSYISILSLFFVSCNEGIFFKCEKDSLKDKT